MAGKVIPKWQEVWYNKNILGNGGLIIEMNKEVKEKTLRSGGHILPQMYHDGFFPQERFKESPETIKAWHKLEKSETELESHLKAKELELFHKILLERKELTSSLLKDSFLCYFCMGARLIDDILKQ